MPAPTHHPLPGTVVVFLTGWCPYCAALRRDLDAAGVDWQPVDVDDDPEAAAFVEGVNGGNRVVPTVLFADGSTLTNPPVDQVVSRLEGAAGV